MSSEVGSGENFRESHLFAVGVDFALDFESGETVALEFAEFVEGFVGSTFLESTEFDEALHVGEPRVVIGFVYPAVLSLEFEDLCTVDLEGGESVAAECFFFEGAFGEAILAQFLDVVGEVGLRFCVGSEEGVGAGIEAVSYGVAGRGGATFG